MTTQQLDAASPDQPERKDMAALQRDLADVIGQMTDRDWLDHAVGSVRQATDDIREWLDAQCAHLPKVGLVPEPVLLSDRLEAAVDYLETVRNMLYPDDAASQGGDDADPR
jgi:hypothetical protein